MVGYRLPYTKNEEEMMLQFIIDQNAYCVLRGISFWKLMENQEFTNRTYQSLKEHFRKVIINKLLSPTWYKIPEEEKIKIFSCYKSTEAPSRQGIAKGAREFSQENYIISDDSE